LDGTSEETENTFVIKSRQKSMEVLLKYAQLSVIHCVQYSE